MKKFAAFALSVFTVLSIMLSSFFGVNAATSISWNFKDTNFKSLGTISSTVTVDDLTLVATSSKTMSVKSNTVTVDSTSYTYCLALGGGGSTSYRSVKVPVSGASTIKVIADAASTRTLVLADSNGTSLGTNSVTSTAELETFTYTGLSGYVYL